MRGKITIFIILALAYNVMGETIIPGGPVSGVWTLAGSPYLVQGDIDINRTSTLTIEPGVDVLFQGYYRLLCEGQLLAVGTVSDSIIFQKDACRHWKGIHFHDSISDSIRLEYCVIMDAVGDNVISNPGGGICIESCSLTIENSTVTRNSSYARGGGGIFIEDGRLTILNCNIDSNSVYRTGKGGGLFISFSNVNVCNSTITFNNAQNIYTSVAGGIYCANSIVSFSNCDISHNTGMNSWSTYGGGAVYSEHCDIRYKDCIFYENVGAEGAAIYSHNDSLIISDCNFDHNNFNLVGASFTLGGGIFSHFSTAIIENSTFISNEANRGGGIYDMSNNLTLRNCSFNDNSGSGLYNTHNSNIMIDSCTFIDNSASNNGGGGAYFYNGGSGTSMVTIQNSNFVSNYGGALKTVSAQLNLLKCNIIDNSANEGGGIKVKNDRSITIEDCIFSGGSSLKGGGIYIDYSGPWIGPSPTQIRRTLIMDNTASSGGGGIYTESGELILENCTIVNNQSPLYGSGIRVSQENGFLNCINSIVAANTGSAGIHFEYNNTLSSITHSDFFCFAFPNFSGNVLPDLGILSSVNVNNDSCDIYNNIFLDPLFVDPLNGDYHLTENSPCIDAGDPLSPLDPDSTIADIGAFYFDHNVGVAGEKIETVPTEFNFYPCYPNPFNPEVTLSFDIPKNCEGSLKIYDITGREIQDLGFGIWDLGTHSVVWNGIGCGSGVYFVRLEAGDYVKTQKVILLK